MLSFRRRFLLTIGIPVAIAAGFLLADAFTHTFTHEPWPDVASLILAGLLLVASSAILTIHQQTLARRAQARTILASQEASYRTLFDQFPEPVTVWSGEGKLLIQNLVSARNMGGSREDYLGKTVIEMFGPEAGQGYLERLRRVYQTGATEEQEDVVLLSTGQRYFWTAMQRVSRPDGSNAVQAISYDITERVQAEQAWRAEHERASMYLNVAALVFIALDLDGNVKLINATACKLLGYAESEIVGKNWFDTCVPERLRAQVRNDYNRLAPLIHEAQEVYENPILTRSGEERLIRWHGSVLRDEEGNPVGTLSSGEDITERRRAEEALRASETLRIQERSALEERQRLARELHDSVSQALYGIALGVNTALAVFDRDREAARDALNYSLGLARAGLSEMRALIFELRPESLQSEGLVAALGKTAEAMRARFEVSVNLEICEEPDLPLPVKEAVYRIAQEALHNAIKHAQAGELTVGLSCDNSCLTLTVRDDGIGFDPVGLYPGHLGLQSMRERAASIGASINITSRPGEGSLVQVQIPLGTAQE